MHFDDLLKERAIEPVSVTNEEIADLLNVARRDITTAQNIESMDLDWAFVIGYNAILQLSIAYMNHLGYRPRGEGKHMNTFRFMQKALPEKDQRMVKRLQQLRRKRNLTVYERTGLVGEKEAHETIQFAGRYYEDVLSKLPREITDLIDQEPEE